VPESFDRLIPYVAQALGVPNEALLDAFRPATEPDLPGILTLRHAVTPDMWWNDDTFVRWRYLNRAMPDGTVPYWIFVKDSAVLGACGLEPVTLVVDGKPVSAVRTLDIMVRPDMDGRGLGAFMNLMLFKRFPITIVTGCNASSEHLISRMFHHTTDLVFWKTVMASHTLIERLYTGPLSRTLASGADLLLALARWNRDRGLPTGMNVRELSGFDDRVTDLSLRCEQPGRVLVRRDAEYLNWRFFENPRCRYRAYGAFTGDRLDGYVVTRLNLSRPNPRREGEIVDWLVAGNPDDPHHSLSALVACGLKGLIREGAGLVTCAAHGADVARAVEANGFRLREGQRIPFFVRAGAADLHQRLTSEPGWFLTRGDLDVE
jgi:GNAT superfamily N-acetyltransferase